MNAIPFDTLKLARGLEAAGMTPTAATGMAGALAEAMTEADVATKADLTLLRTELKGEFVRVDGEFGKVRMEIAATRAELKADIAGLRTELKADIADLRAETKADIAGLRADTSADIAALRAETKAGTASLAASIDLLRRDMTIKLGSMIFLAAGLIVAAMRLLPPAHF